MKSSKSRICIRKTRTVPALTSARGKREPSHLAAIVESTKFRRVPCNARREKFALRANKSSCTKNLSRKGPSPAQRFSEPGVRDLAHQPFFSEVSCVHDHEDRHLGRERHSLRSDSTPPTLAARTVSRLQCFWIMSASHCESGHQSATRDTNHQRRETSKHRRKTRVQFRMGNKRSANTRLSPAIHLAL